VKEVYTIEIVETLGKNAAKVLREQGYSNVQAKVGDGYLGWPEHAPFDKIIVTCSPEKPPQPLIDQLKDGGKMIIPLGERYAQVFYLFEKKNGELVKQKLLPALFVPMTGVSEEKREVRPDPANPQVYNGSFEIDDDGDGHPEGWYYQRQLKLATQLAPDGKQYVVFENFDPGRGAQMLQGMAVDGSKVSSIEVRLQVRGANLKFGPSQYDKPALFFQFYDANRKPLPEDMIGPWKDSFNWKKVSDVVHVPPLAREAIVRIGLNGGTGTLSVDDIRITPVSR